MSVVNRLSELLLPVTELTEKGIEVFLPLFCTMILRIGKTKKKVEKLFFCLVNKFAVSITPLAVVFIKCSIRFFADVNVFTQRIAAALAIECSGRSQKCIDGDIKDFGKQLKRFGIRLGFACFPAADCLSGYRHFLSQLFLAETVFGSQCSDNFTCFHGFSLSEENTAAQQPSVALAFKVIMLICSRSFNNLSIPSHDELPKKNSS